ncbi:MAG: N-acetylmuramoyl-L-alanine amidase [Bacteroidetes bacterium]|nr:N-acetylmuramoyl-L-alanine amidase [Bacteroidota bacterium]
MALVPFLSFNQTTAKLKTVVIDAGHGGKDPGCHGGYSNEKDVCLSMALKLGKLIQESFPEVSVKYTRETDVFIELIERANIANRVNADLFICIHANAGSTTAYGTESYVLGLHRTESQKKVMERENSIISLEDDKGAKYKEFDLTPDAMIAIQLQQNVNLNNAIKFASALQQEFKTIGRSDRGVKQAGFLVLYKTAMPSVLIETGFLTNPTEEAFIGKTDGQDKMSKAMFNAFKSYKLSYEGKTQAAPKNDTPKPVPSLKTDSSQILLASDVFFSVQVISSVDRLELSSAKFKGEKVYEYSQDNLYKYYTGIFVKDLEAAKKHKLLMQEKGFSSAFVIAFSQGERVSIEKAIKLAEK